MNFYSNLYIGEKVSNHKHIVDLLNKNIYTYNIYLICVNIKTKVLLTIIDSKELFKTINNYSDYTIIGLANGKPEALELTKKIIFEHYSKNKDFKGFKLNFTTL